MTAVAERTRVNALPSLTHLATDDQTGGAPEAVWAEYRHAEARFFAKVEVDQRGCWLWTAALNADGYGVFNAGRRMQLAHRWLYRSLISADIDSLVLDHLCRVRRCVNAFAHLDPVVPLVNTQRAPFATANHCVNGHAFTPENTYLRPADGRRQCRACKHVNRMRFKARWGR